VSYLLVIFWLIYLWRWAAADSVSARSRLLTLGLLAATCGLMFVRFVFPLHGYLDIFTIDDSYITLTAQRNLAEHNLFAVNPAAPLAGITSPLHVAVVGLLAKLMPLGVASRLFGLLAFMALCFGVFVWAELLGADTRLATAAAVVVAVSGQMTAYALNGLETILFTAAIIWCFAAYELARRRTGFFYLLGFLLGLSILTRPEGWFLAGALYLVAVAANLRRWRVLLHVALSGMLALAVVAPYLILNHVLLGAFFPLTVSAKKYFFAEMCRPWSDRFRTLGDALAILLGAFVWAAPLLIWSKAFLRRIYPLLFILIFYAAYLIEFAGALLHYGGRYEHPLVPVLLTGAVLGADGLVRWARRFPSWIPRFLTGGLIVLFAWLTAFSGVTHQHLYRFRLEHTKNELLPVVDWLKAHSAPGDLIAAHDIGALYYFGERPVLDLVGLTDPEVAHVHADLADPCRDRAMRKIALYMLLEERRPKLISMFQKWDVNYLGLRHHDEGRHIREVGHLSTGAGGSVYYFYECDWERNLKKHEPPAPALSQ
jgi:hypothetical protein